MTRRRFPAQWGDESDRDLFRWTLRDVLLAIVAFLVFSGLWWVAYLLWG
jgi:hypothetical protein